MSWRCAACQLARLHRHELLPAGLYHHTGDVHSILAAWLTELLSDTTGNVI